MIAKGAARNNPRQLAVYLMRVERYETGEPVELLELQSGWAGSLKPGSDRLRIASRMIEAFRDWQVLTEGTRQGRDGLYHAEISPAPFYAAKMTPEQWVRAAEILGEELGFQNQPRAIVLHGGTDGRKHLHVVWARTDIDQMKIISDSYNFVAHEKASHRMELEFGHEFVPGKHDKRDREKQPEFPRQDHDYAEAQMAERTGMTVAERKAEIAALKLTAANGLEFKHALEEAGYVLAKGERGYIVVDEAGVFSALSKNLGMKKAQVETFMADVPLDQLPTIEEAKTLQKQRALTTQQAKTADISDARQSKTGEISAAERKEQITALRAAADNALAFKNALEEAGYVLAKGDTRGMVLVNAEGEVFNLSKHVTDIKGKAFKAFMAPIDQAALPTVEEAKALHKQREEEAAVKAEKPAPEASKFLTPAAPEKAPEPAPAPPVSKFLPRADAPAPVSPPPAPQVKPFDYELYASYNRQPALPAPVVELPAPVVAPQQSPDQPASKFLPEKETVQPTPTAEKPAGIDLTLYAPKAPAQPKAPAADDWTSKHITPEFKGLQPPEPPSAPKPKRPWEERDIVDLRRSIWKSQRAEYQEFADQNGRDYKQQGAVLDNENRLRMEDFDIAQRAALEAERERLLPKPGKGFRGLRDAIRRTLNPQDQEAVAAAKQEELALFRSQQAHDRRDYIKTLEQNKRVELEKFRDGQLAQQAERERNYNEEIERRVAEYKEGKRLAAELEADQRQQQRERDREGSTTKRIQRSREPLPSDPWMAQIGGKDKLSPDHLASAQRSYEAWRLKDRYDFRDYVSYVQRQWEQIDLPPAPQSAAPQPPEPAYDPTTSAPKAGHWTEEEIRSKFNALQPPPEDAEIKRRIAEFKEAKRIAAELEADQREQELKREGPEPPEEGKG